MRVYGDDDVTSQVRVRGYRDAPDNDLLEPGYMVADDLVRTGDDSVMVIESKLSAAAPLTSAQATHLPLLGRNGGRVVGSGSGAFPQGTEIPPASIRLVRPDLAPRAGAVVGGARPGQPGGGGAPSDPEDPSSGYFWSDGPAVIAR